MRKVVIIDSYSSDSFHEMFNACFLLISDRVFDDIKYIVSNGQKNAILDVIKKSGKIVRHKIKFRKCFVVKDSGKYSFLMKCFISALWNLVYFFVYRRKRTLIYNINNPLFSIVLCYLTRWFSAKVIVVNHGELEYLRYKESCVDVAFTRLSKIWGVLLRKSFNVFRNQEGIRFIVLGDEIKKKLFSISDLSLDQICVMEHPYIFKVMEEKMDFSNCSNWNIGTIGGLNPIKGGQYFIDLLTNMKYRNDVNWHVVGNFNFPLPSFTNLKVHAQGHDTLSREQFEILVSQLHLALYFYSHGYYKLMASGAIFDAINYEIPIVSLRNDYFTYLFKKYGDFGILCDSVKEMEDAICGILCDPHKISLYCEVLREIKVIHDVEQVACSLDGSLREFL